MIISKRWTKDTYEIEVDFRHIEVDDVYIDVTDKSVYMGRGDMYVGGLFFDHNGKLVIKRRGFLMFWDSCVDTKRFTIKDRKLSVKLHFKDVVVELGNTFSYRDFPSFEINKTQIIDAPFAFYGDKLVMSHGLVYEWDGEKFISWVASDAEASVYEADEKYHIDSLVEFDLEELFSAKSEEERRELVEAYKLAEAV